MDNDKSQMEKMEDDKMEIEKTSMENMQDHIDVTWKSLMNEIDVIKQALLLEKYLRLHTCYLNGCFNESCKEEYCFHEYGDVDFREEFRNKTCWKKMCNMAFCMKQSLAGFEHMYYYLGFVSKGALKLVIGANHRLFELVW